MDKVETGYFFAVFLGAHGKPVGSDRTRCYMRIRRLDFFLGNDRFFLAYVFIVFQTRSFCHFDNRWAIVSEHDIIHNG